MTFLSGTIASLTFQTINRTVIIVRSRKQIGQRNTQPVFMVVNPARRTAVWRATVAAFRQRKKSQLGFLIKKCAYKIQQNNNLESSKTKSDVKVAIKEL